MRYEPASAALFQSNRLQLSEILDPASVVIVHANDVMPSNADGTLPFRQNSDLFYLTGIDQEETVLVLWPRAPNASDREVLFIRETSPELAIWEGPKLSQDEAQERAGLQSVRWTSSFEAHLHRVMPQVQTVYLLTNEHLRAEAVVETRNDRFIKRCQRLYPLHRYERLAPLMNRLRPVKKAEEIKMTREAVEITRAGFERVLKFIKPGVGEWEIEAEYLHEFVRRRSRGFAYSPIVGSGANACILHYLKNSGRCQDGEMVLMDVGAEYGNYNADMTRTVPVNGRFTPRQKEVYQAVLNVMRGANKILRPGMTMKAYQAEVVAMMASELVAVGLISKKDYQEKETRIAATRRYFMHGASHHLGLDVHDVCEAERPVEAGMLFTIEPGIYIPEEKLGIRLENNVHIGAEGNLDLFEAFPLEVDEIEEAMNS